MTRFLLFVVAVLASWSPFAGADESAPDAATEQRTVEQWRN
jgi:hypothetical protein